MPSSLPARRVRFCHSLNVIGPAVVRLRQAYSWTQEELVAQLQLRNCDVSRDIVANIETGRCSASDAMVHVLAQVFGVPESELFPRHADGANRVGITPETAIRRRHVPPPGASCPHAPAKTPMAPAT